IETIDGAKWAMVAHHVRGGGANLGYRERLDHLAAIKAGAPCFLVLCDAHDPSTRPRRILKFDARILGVGGNLKVDADRTWMRVSGYKLAAEVRLPRSAGGDAGQRPQSTPSSLGDLRGEDPSGIAKERISKPRRTRGREGHEEPRGRSE